MAEDGDAKQGAWRIVRAERVPDHLPGGNQVLPPGRRDQDPGADAGCAGGSAQPFEARDRGRGAWDEDHDHEDYDADHRG